MSLTTKSIETSGAALAALCIAGAASPANANTVNLGLSYNSNLYTTIAIDSATPQFYYDSEVHSYKTEFGTLNSGAFANVGVGPSNNFINSGATYGSNTGGIKVAGIAGADTGYLQLSWLNGSNVQEYGYATLNNGDLVSITGNDITITTESVANTPLPASWALFIGGTGLLGLVAQQRRRRLKLAA